jgi:hypothetical protein
VRWADIRRALARDTGWDLVQDLTDRLAEAQARAVEASAQNVIAQQRIVDLVDEHEAQVARLTKRIQELTEALMAAEQWKLDDD